MREIFPDGRVISAYRRPENLKELLAPSKYKSHRTTINQETILNLAVLSATKSVAYVAIIF